MQPALSDKATAAGVIAVASVGVFWILYLSSGLMVFANFLAFGGSKADLLGDLIWILLSGTAITTGWFAAKYGAGATRRHGIFAIITGIIQIALLGLTLFIVSM